MDQVVITGIGIICSIGQNVALFTESIRDGRSGVGELLGEKDKGPRALGASIHNFNFEDLLAQYNKVPANLLKKASLTLNNYIPLQRKTENYL